MADERLAAALGAAARQRIRSSYSFERMTAQFEALYATQLGRRQPAEREPMAS
jgi:glycosyltransferase involved in cell wall biosynthesis